MPQKELLVVGGPNGSGKSTFVAEYLSRHPRPYNAGSEFVEVLFGYPDGFAVGDEALFRRFLEFAGDEQYG